MNTTADQESIQAAEDRDIGELAMSNADISAAMTRISGYLDISTEDFREIYHLAHHNAVDRLIGSLRAANMLRPTLQPLTADLPLDQAARMIVDSGYKGLPVVDRAGKVIGMLTEADFLRRLKAGSFLEMMLRLISDAGEFSHCCHESRVAEAMTAEVVTVHADADFRQVLDAFRHHPGRSMPVVDGEQRLRGMLLRKDLLAAFDWNTPA